MKIYFSNHAYKRSEKRKIHRTYVIETIKTPDKLLKLDNKYYAYKRLNGKAIEVIYEKRKNFIYVRTVYWI